MEGWTKMLRAFDVKTYLVFADLVCVVLESIHGH